MEIKNQYYLNMVLSAKNLKIITKDVKTNVLTLDYSKLQLETPRIRTTCSCMCKNCGCGPLAPGVKGRVELCASCRL